MSIELSDYVTGLPSATLTGAEEVYLQGDEKTTVEDIANFGGLKTKIVNIGDWNMDSSGSVFVTHGIADHLKIRSVDVLIMSDPASTLVSLTKFGSSGVSQGSIGQITNTTIVLFRVTGGHFDQTLYSSTPFNRGYVTIQYLP